MLRKSLNLLMFGVKFKAMTRFDVFLDFHTENVCVNWQGDFVLHRLYFSLLLFYRTTHIVHSLLESLFHVTALLDFFSKPLLVQTGLLPHLLVMQFEILVQRLQLLFFCVCGLEVTLNCA